MAVYVGIDVHKKYCQAALMNDHGHPLQELRFDNTSQGASSLVDLAKSVDSHVKAVVEPSANFWISHLSLVAEPSLRHASSHTLVAS